MGRCFHQAQGSQKKQGVLGSTGGPHGLLTFRAIKAVAECYHDTRLHMNFKLPSGKLTWKPTMEVDGR